MFANAHRVSDRILTLVATAEPPARVVVLDLQAVWEIDVTAAGTLIELHDDLEGRGIDLRFARANRPLREQIHRMLAGHHAAHERFFPSASAAVDDFLAGAGDETGPRAIGGEARDS